MIPMNVKYVKMRKKYNYDCQEIWKMKENHEYEKTMTGNVREKLEVARILKENM